jgi:hypothetical protein
MADSYQRVRKTETIPENEVRVSSLGGNSEYISKAAELLKGKKLDEVIVRGLRGATSNVITVVDVLRRKIKGLHLDWKLEILSTDEEYLPLQEGLDKKVINRRVPTLLAVLSFTAKDTKSPGYQPPLPDSKVTDTPLEELRSGPRRFTNPRPQVAAQETSETYQSEGDRPTLRRPRGRYIRGGNRFPRGGKSESYNREPREDQGESRGRGRGRRGRRGFGGRRPRGGNDFATRA